MKRNMTNCFMDTTATQVWTIKKHHEEYGSYLSKKIACGGIKINAKINCKNSSAKFICRCATITSDRNSHRGGH